MDNENDPWAKKYLSQEYLQKQLIAYIGNKRSLLSFLGPLWMELLEGKKPGRLLDPFSGSGVCARLGKTLGFEVWANDWEDYAYHVGRAHLLPSPQEAENLFASQGGIAKVFQELNRQGNSPWAPTVPYFSRFFSPENTANPQLGKERLFFTQENGRFLDHSRQWIEEAFPPISGNEAQGLRRSLLISSLIYQASVHSNTNGVFKAFHKGFGGHGKDALSRIMRPMEAQVPLLYPGQNVYRFFQMDAKKFVSQGSAQIVYLDPPYNQHQYGSNYHVLNSLALWDKPESSLELNAEGQLREKASIRKDWVKRKSSYCVRSQAQKEFSSLLDHIDAPYITLSYNTEGIMNFQDLYEILAQQGRAKIHTQDYIQYRGGRQSDSRKNNNLEMVFVLNREERSQKGDWNKVKLAVERKKIQILTKTRVHPQRMRNYFFLEDNLYKWKESPQGISGELGVNYRWKRFNIHPPLSDNEVYKLSKTLENLQCKSQIEEIEILREELEKNANPKDQKFLIKDLFKVMRKITFRKYKGQYHHLIQSLGEIKISQKEVQKIFLNELEKLNKLAELRFY